MGSVNGDVVIRAGSEDPVTLQLLQDDGVAPIDLTGITALTLRMKADAVKTFTDPKFVVSDAANGKVTLSQVAADFPSQARYFYYVTFIDSAGKAHAVPEDKNYWWEVTAPI